MSSANPATPLTRAEFQNSCTSVMQGLNCLFRQGALVNEALGGSLQELGTITMNLMDEVMSNKEFYVDGPLVRYLTAEVSKGKVVIQEIKRTCSQQSAARNGPDYIHQHNEQHLKDIQSVLQALNTFNQNRLFRSDTQHLESEIHERMSNTSASRPQSTKLQSNTTNPFMTTPLNTPAQNGIASYRPQPSSSGQVGLGDSMVPSGGGDPSVPGTFEHIHDVATAGRQPHSDSWPKHTDTPPRVLENNRPPLVYSGLRDVHNYRNLPQFTGVNLPIANLPSGELGHQAPHTQHWGHTNKYVF